MVIHSAEVNKVNPFGYLVPLQRYHALVEESPEEWMPWNYAAILESLGRNRRKCLKSRKNSQCSKTLVAF